MSSYDEIDIQSARKDYADIKHAAHAMIWAKTSAELFGKHAAKAWVLMTLRFDGKFGFPGGFVEAEETIEEGLSRELREEIHLEEKEMRIEKQDQICAHLGYNHSRTESVCTICIRNHNVGFVGFSRFVALSLRHDVSDSHREDI